MILFRSAEDSDLETIYQLSMESGIGITTLSKNKDVLKKRLALSVESFRSDITQPHDEYYLFVIEDVLTHEVVGVSAIKSSIGLSTPSYFYKIITRSRFCLDLNMHHDEQWLILVNDSNNRSELCTLYLKPEYRHSQNGVFLSRARFLFMAQHPARFHSHIIAEMRGVADPEGNSPFWSSLGEHFFQMSFQQADELTLSSNKKFIDDLIPEYPISVQLLDIKAQEVLGKPHQSTVPAMRILWKEGFYYDNTIDIFDAGPIVEAHREQIHTIQSSLSLPIIKIIDTLDAQNHMISNTQTSFRAVIGPLEVNQQGAVITQRTAQMLAAKLGDHIRFAQFN